jgi:hypothetical protein
VSVQARRRDERVRLEDRLRTLGTRDPRCLEPGCLERDPYALTGTFPAIVCYEHQALAHGRPWLEEHHVAGRHNSPVKVPIPGNDHEVTKELQLRWPQRTLRNPDGSPLLRAAAAVRGWSDVMRIVLDRVVEPVPGLLEDLDAWLRSVLGERWFEAFEQWRRGP